MPEVYSCLHFLDDYGYRASDGTIIGTVTAPHTGATGTFIDATATPPDPTHALSKVPKYLWDGSCSRSHQTLDSSPGLIHPPKNFWKGRVEFTITRGGGFKKQYQPAARARDRWPVNAPEALVNRTPIPLGTNRMRRFWIADSRDLGLS